MKIGMNNVGNYAPHVKLQKEYVSNNKAGDLQEDNASLNKAGITGEEKKFFSGLYPENKSEIVDYHFYEKTGRMSGVKLGSLLDKRG